MTKKALVNFETIAARLENNFYHNQFPVIKMSALTHARNEEFKLWLSRLGISEEICEKMEALDDKNFADVQYIRALLRELFVAYRVANPRINGIPEKTQDSNPGEKVEKPVAKTKAKKTSKGLLNKFFLITSWFFKKFMVLNLVGKAVILIMIFSLLSQFGGPKSPAEPTEAEVATAVPTTVIDPFDELDNPTPTPAPEATPTAPPEKTFEQIKQELIGLQTTINFCSPIEEGDSIGYATARSGSDLKDKENDRINNATSVTILDVVESNAYDFNGKAGCKSNLRVKVRTDSGQESWVHGSTVMGVAK